MEASEPQVGNSMWVTSLMDPDRYQLEFESATDVAGGYKLPEVQIDVITSPKTKRDAFASLWFSAIDWLVLFLFFAAFFLVAI